MFFLILLSAILLESSVTTVPLTLAALILYAVSKKDPDVLVFGFFSGILLDILTLGIVGKSAIFFVIFLALILMYERKFEMGSIYYLSFFSFLGLFSYSFLKGAYAPIPLAIFSTILSILIFKLFMRTERNVEWQQR